MWEIIWLRPPHPGHTMMNSWDEVLICQTIVISPQLLRSAVVVVAEPRVGVAKAKQRLMTQLNRNLLWKLSSEQLKLNGNRSQSKELPQNWDESEIRQLKKRRHQAQFECLSSKAWPLRVLQFWRPPFHLLPPTATETGTQICLADRMRYNDNADDARNELQLLRLECATILVEQSSLDWLHLSGQWDLCTVQKSGQSGLCGCLASFGLILCIVYGFQVCVDLCNHFMVTLCVRKVNQQQIAPPVQL